MRANLKKSVTNQSPVNKYLENHVNISTLSVEIQNELTRDKIASQWANKVETGKANYLAIRNKIMAIPEPEKSSDMLDRFNKYMNMISSKNGGNNKRYG